MGGDFPEELIDWSDTIIFMHEPEILQKNWSKFKGKRVILRTIGQLMPHQEQMLQQMKSEGLQIVRYSPQEAKMQNYAGEDALIRFYKDPGEYGGYTGVDKLAVNITQSITQRDRFVYREELMEIMKDFPHKIFGIGNEDLPDFGGMLTPDGLRKMLRDSRVYIYGGTYPAAYTLALIEAMMTGIPVIALGWNFTATRFEGIGYSEIPEIIMDGVNGFLINDTQKGRNVLNMLLEEPDKAKAIGYNGRARAIELFGKEKIAAQWKEFLGE